MKNTKKQQLAIIEQCLVKMEGLRVELGEIKANGTILETKILQLYGLLEFLQKQVKND